MNGTSTGWRGALALRSAFAAGHAAAQTRAAAAGGWRVPRTSSADPDLWDGHANGGETGTPPARPDEFAGLKRETIVREKVAEIAGERNSPGGGS
jgi:hypothetical protein